KRERRQKVHDYDSDVVDGHIPIVAGMIANVTHTAEKLIRDVQAEDACLIVQQAILDKTHSTQLSEFYGEVARAAADSDTEVMVQDAPGATGVSMTPQLIGDLATLDNVTSVKVESPPTAPKVTAVRAALREPAFAILGGHNAQFVLDEYSRGAIGTMPACEFVDVLGPVLTAWQTGRTEEAWAGFARLLPLIVFGLQQG